MRWFFLCVVVPWAGACAVDPELTCGAPCVDGAAVSDTGADGTIAADASDASTDGAPQDVVTTDSNCKGDGGYCQSNGQCCSNACSEYGKCTASCGAQSAACSQQTCCFGLYCTGSSCAQCKQDNAACSQDYECCGGGCQNSDAGQRCTGN